MQVRRKMIPRCESSQRGASLVRKIDVTLTIVTYADNGYTEQLKVIFTERYVAPRLPDRYRGLSKAGEPLSHTGLGQVTAWQKLNIAELRRAMAVSTPSSQQKLGLTCGTVRRYRPSSAYLRTGCYTRSARLSVNSRSLALTTFQI